MKKLFTITFALLFFITASMAQTWRQKMADPSVNFYEVQKEFYKYHKKNLRKEKLKNIIGKSEKQNEEQQEEFVQFKRWEWYTQQRVYPSGNRLTPLNEYSKWLSENLNSNNRMMQSGNWSLIGPTTSIPNNGGGAGRMNCFKVHPTNTNIIYGGAAAGGFWISTNGGNTWSTTTDQIPSLGVTDIAINPLSPNIIYIATGDADGGDTHSVGVLKSIDGGQTWAITGLCWTIQQVAQISKLIIHPTNPDILLAATSSGVYRTIDGGVTWSKTLAAAGMKDIEFKVSNPRTVYAANGTNFFRSTNGGVTFSIITSGLPGTGQINRLAIAVTEADSNYVYVLASKSIGNGFYGIYLSTNGGSSFSLQTNTPNLLGWDSNGSDSGGQGWYDLAIDASPTNKNEIIVGGVNIWRSTDAGVNWLINAHWWGNNAPYVHADIHDLYYLNGTTYFAACDGGIFKTTNSGASWTDLSNGLQVAQMYRLGCSAQNANLIIQGWQDNGTSKVNNGIWTRIYGGDGMECLIDYSNQNTMYCELYYGDIYRSTNGGSSWTGITGANIPETGDWVTPYVQDPNTPNTIYVGMTNLFKSTNQGNTWTQISNWGSGALKAIAVAPSNSNYIYVTHGNSFYRTTNGGNTWTTLTSTLPGSTSITYIAISATDPNMVWLSYSGYIGNSKVFKSTDGGTTWTNLASNTLPNLPVNTIVSQTGTADGVYIGTDVGVYYIDNNLTSWVGFNNGLPNVDVNELEIHYASGKLRAATYGRGLWETNLYNPASLTPLANFNANRLYVCPGDSVQFTDLSTNNPTSWSWVFPGGTPSTSTLQNPVVYYNTPANYFDVELHVTNNNGTDAMMKYGYIGVSSNPQPTIQANFDDTICSNQYLILYASQGVTYSWIPSNTTLNQYHPTQAGDYLVRVTDMFGCIGYSDTFHLFIYQQPAAPVITLNGDTVCSNYATGNQWYLNGVPISGATGQCHVITQPGNYYTIITENTVCTAQSNTVVGTTELSDVYSQFAIFPNPTNGTFLVSFIPLSPGNIELKITDIAGKEIYVEQFNNSSGIQNNKMDISDLAKGSYLITIKSASGTATKKIMKY